MFIHVDEALRWAFREQAKAETAPGLVSSAYRGDKVDGGGGEAPVGKKDVADDILKQARDAVGELGYAALRAGLGESREGCGILVRYLGDEWTRAPDMWLLDQAMAWAGIRPLACGWTFARWAEQGYPERTQRRHADQVQRRLVDVERAARGEAARRLALVGYVKSTATGKVV